MDQNLQTIIRLIREAGRILIITHVAPDGDAIGSALALTHALEALGKECVPVCRDPVPLPYRYLPGSDRLTNAPRGSFDLVISLDCSDLQRLGTVYDRERYAHIPLINIDHHVTNVQFGTVNWVDPRAAATAQMLVHLIRALEIPLNETIATCLLNGILTDTRGFRTSNTTPEVMEDAVTLMRAGAPLAEITEQVFNRHPLTMIRLWSEALQGLRLDGHVLWTQITREMRERTGHLEESDGGLVSFLASAVEADIAVVFNEQADGQVDVSIRAVPGFDVSQVALSLGGGGHPQAAGCTLPGPLDVVRERVLAALQQAWAEQAGNRS